MCAGEDELRADEIGRRIASQWKHDPEAVGATQASLDATKAADTVDT